MKLFYSPGACSLAPHIVCRELGLPLEIERVDTKAGKTERGTSFLTVNPKGYVPALQLDDGQVLTECPVIVQYLADRRPEAGLAPPQGTLERYRLQEWLSYITSEMHKGIGSLFNPRMPAEFRTVTKELVGKRLDYLSGRLSDRQFLMGGAYTVADAYLFVVLGWCRLHEIDLAPWKPVADYVGRIAARPAVQAALKAEGLA